jgi:hypothetical protein
MDANAVATAKAMGWPWDRLAEVVYERIDAGRLAELVLGNPGATAHDRERAAFELEAALAREHDARDELASVFLLMLRAAIDTRPDALRALVEAFAADVQMRALMNWLVTSKPGGMGHAMETDRRMTRIGAELANLRDEVGRLKRENWELARELAAHRKRKVLCDDGNDSRPRDAFSDTAAGTVRERGPQLR